MHRKRKYEEIFVKTRLVILHYKPIFKKDTSIADKIQKNQKRRINRLK
jgi:hypothetical protein